MGALSVMVTAAWSVSVTVLPSSSSAVAAPMFSSVSPALLKTNASMEQLYASPGTMICGTAQSPWPFRSP